MLLDVAFAVAIIWIPFHMAFNDDDDEDEPTLMGSIANFFAGLFLSPFIMALAAIDLCVTLSVLCLSPITRILATILHMLSYALSGANDDNNSLDGLDGSDRSDQSNGWCP